MAELSQSKLLKSNLVGFSIHKMYSANAMKRGSFFMRKFFPLWQKPLLLFLLVFFLPLLCKLLHQNLYEQEKYPLIEDFFPFGKNHFYFSYWYSSCICFANCCVKTFMNRKNIRSLRIFSPFGKNCFYFSYWCFPGFALQAAASKPL